MRILIFILISFNVSAQYPSWSEGFVEDGGFSPDDISGLSAWYDGADIDDDGVLNNNPASPTTWHDKTGNRDLTITGSTSYQSLNGNETIDFPSGSYAEDGAAIGYFDFLHKNESTVFIVSELPNHDGIAPLLSTQFPASTQSGYVIFSEDRPGENLQSIRTQIGDGVAGSWVVDVRSAQNTYTLGAYHLLYNEMDADNGVAADRNNMEVDQVAISANNTFTTSPTSGTSSASLRIGSRFAGDNTNRSSINIAEVIIYNRKLTTSEITEINNYISNKWGL